MRTTRKITLPAIIAMLALFTLITTTEAQTVQNDKILSEPQKSIVAIAALTAVGDLDKLETALSEGLDAGLTVNEIKEILVQMYAYAGFPRSLNGMSAFMAVMDERAQKGIQDTEGPAAKPMSADIDRNEYGKNVRLQLTGRVEEGPPAGYQLFAPIIDDFLKEHLFADIFYRDVLDFQSRELATTAALAAIGDVNPQLASHFNIALNTGLTPNQLQALTTVIAEKISAEKGANAAKVLTSVLENRK